MLFVLAKFDIRVGNQVVWTSEPIDNASLPGVEFKMIPSGLHDRIKETIYFVSGSWHGVARYEARTSGNGRDPGTTMIYSLAALAPMDEDLPWGQESLLAMELRRFMDLGGSVEPNSSALNVLPLTHTSRLDPRSHPILATASFLAVYGPMVFEIWKAGLARNRTLLAAIPGQSLRKMSQFTYIAAQISAIPSDVADLVPTNKPPVPLLYNVAVSDLQRLQSAESFWATTTEGLLLTPSRDACDCYADAQSMHDLTSGTPGRKVVPTWRDRHRFSLLLDALNVHDVPTSSGIMEALVDSTANGLLWWASAGESTMIDRDETAPLLGSPQTLTATQGIDSSGNFVVSPGGLDTSSDVVALIGQFQQYTRQFIRVFAKIASDDDITIRVSIQDIAAMGLDPVASSDREFIKRFAFTWWDRPVVFVRSWCCC